MFFFSRFYVKFSCNGVVKIHDNIMLQLYYAAVVCIVFWQASDITSVFV